MILAWGKHIMQNRLATIKLSNPPANSGPREISLWKTREEDGTRFLVRIEDEGLLDKDQAQKILLRDAGSAVYTMEELADAIWPEGGSIAASITMAGSDVLDSEQQNLLKDVEERMLMKTFALTDIERRMLQEFKKQSSEWCGRVVDEVEVCRNPVTGCIEKMSAGIQENFEGYNFYAHIESEWTKEGWKQVMIKDSSHEEGSSSHEVHTLNGRPHRSVLEGPASKRRESRAIPTEWHEEEDTMTFAVNGRELLWIAYGRCPSAGWDMTGGILADENTVLDFIKEVSSSSREGMNIYRTAACESLREEKTLKQQDRTLDIAERMVQGLNAYQAPAPAPRQRMSLKSPALRLTGEQRDALYQERNQLLAKASIAKSSVKGIAR